MLKPYKYVLQIVVHDLDSRKRIKAELPVNAEDGSPLVFYNNEAAIEWLRQFPAKLDEINAANKPNRAARRRKPKG